MANRNDPTPGRCRRTDGRKWRCSWSCLPHSKYCERHIKRLRGKRSATKKSKNKIGKSSNAPPTRETHAVDESEPLQDPTVNMNPAGADDPSKLVGASSETQLIDFVSSEVFKK